MSEDKNEVMRQKYSLKKILKKLNTKDVKNIKIETLGRKKETRGRPKKTRGRPKKTQGKKMETLGRKKETRGRPKKILNGSPTAVKKNIKNVTRIQFVEIYLLNY